MNRIRRLAALFLALLLLTAGWYWFALPALKWQRLVRAEPDAAANVELVARLIAAESQGEPYEGQVAVGAVIMNRTHSAKFPGTIAGVIYQPWAFESVGNGLIWQRTPSWQERRAAIDAVSGWDPSYGALFFWNPAKPVSAWIWTRAIIRQIGSQVFAR